MKWGVPKKYVNAVRPRDDAAVSGVGESRKNDRKATQGKGARTGLMRDPTRSSI